MPFEGFDFAQFWEQSNYATDAYVGAAISTQLIETVERKLGYKLPQSYLMLLQSQNGGIPRNTCFPTNQATSWADNHVAISGILGIDPAKTYSLTGEIGSEFMKQEWGYPDIGHYIANCPSAGHDMIALDYRKNGKQGEPEVVHVDQESDYQITFLAPDFETFIRGLVNEAVFDSAEADRARDLGMIQHGAFSGALQSLLAQQQNQDYGRIIRNICHQLTQEKGYFSLHADALSYLMYDIQFLLYSSVNRVASCEDYLQAYPALIAFGDGEFTTGGYAPGFVADWMRLRMRKKQISKRAGRVLTFDQAYEIDLLNRLAMHTRLANATPQDDLDLAKTRLKQLKDST